MIPGRHDIDIYKGGTFRVVITARDKESGVSVDFTKYDQIRMQIRPAWIDGADATSPEPLFELSMANGRISKVNANLGLELYISAADTEAMTFTDGQYDLELIDEIVDADTEVDKFLRGKVSVIGEVTV